jgi:hypothetical protein
MDDVFGQTYGIQFVLNFSDHFRHDALGFGDGLAAGGQRRAGDGVPEDGRKSFRFGDTVFAQQGGYAGSILVSNAG